LNGLLNTEAQRIKYLFLCLCVQIKPLASNIAYILTELLMFVKRNIPVSIILRFSWKYLVAFIVWSSFWVICHDFFHQCGIHILIPFAPLGTIGVVLLLPLAMVNEFEKLGDGFLWLTIPFSTVISWIFMTMEIVGDSSEDPFENFINDVPMTALCRNIKIDLREMLGETDLPPRMLPVDGILM